MCCVVSHLLYTHVHVYIHVCSLDNTRVHAWSCLFPHTAATFLPHSDGKYHWDIAVCGALNYSCHGSTLNTSVCQRYDEHQRVSGLQTAQKLQFFDGSLSLRLSGGDKCSNGRSRSTLINFECDRTVFIGEPRYIEVYTVHY